MQNIFFQYLHWQFLEMPRNILSAWRNFLLFNLDYFSVGLLLKTFFSPWRRYSWVYPRGFSISKYLEVFFSNLISRILGAVVRSFLIIFGIVAEVFLIVGGATAFVFWLVLPFLIIFCLVFGISILF